MSEESPTANLEELARRSRAAAKRRDVDTMVENFGPSSVWDDTALGLGTHDGLAEIRAHLEDWMGSYAEFEVEMEKWLDLGNGVTLEVNAQKGRPLGSTGEVHLRYAAVAVWMDGQVKRFTTYTDLDEARAAAERLAVERG